MLISVSVPFLTRVWVPTSLGSGHASSSRATVEQNHAPRFGLRPNISVKAHIIIHAGLADLHIFGFREGKTLKILLICFKCVLQVKVAVLLFFFPPTIKAKQAVLEMTKHFKASESVKVM